MKAWLRTPWVGIFGLLVVSGLSVVQAKENLRLIALEEPYFRYPQEAQDAGIYSGDVQVIVSIDTEGRIADSLMLGYTHPALAASVQQALPRYRFQPILTDGKPAMVRVGLKFFFSTSGLVLSHTSLESLHARFRQLEGPAYTSRLVQKLKDLDEPMVVRRSVQPTNAPGAGKVVLDFYIDETGRARLPAIRSADHPELAEAAAEALLQWEFAPPRRGGEPVVVRAAQQFVFAEKT